MKVVGKHRWCMCVCRFFNLFCEKVIVYLNFVKPKNREKQVC